jgi:hypothetical protein
MLSAVMRAEGVLRLILNVALFTTMRFELAEKFVRFVALEQPVSSTTTSTGDADDGEAAAAAPDAAAGAAAATPVHFALRFGTPAAAAAFAEQVRRAVPRHRPGVAPMPGDEYA